MTDNDVLTELDQWLDPDENKLLPNAVPMIRRARDEIVALREMREAHIRMLSANCSEARAEALEEAARECDVRLYMPDGVQLAAAAIRALKDGRE